jgi:hypothetical protein
LACATTSCGLVRQLARHLARVRRQPLIIRCKSGAVATYLS